MLTRPDQKFRAIVSLSIQLAEGQFQEISQLTKHTFSKDLFHFVASGTKDATYRLKSACKIDNLFKTVKNEHLHLKTMIYNVDHFAVAERGLSDAIAFIFDDFVEDNDFDDALIDSLRKIMVSPLTYIKDYQNKIFKLYDINVQPREEGVISVASTLVQNKQQLRDFWAYKISIYGKDENYNSFYAQNLERLNEYEEALQYWKANLTDSIGSFNKSFFYYRRPMELIAYKLNRPKETIAFAVEWQKKIPEYDLYFNYRIAKICADLKIENDAGLMAIRYCIDHYKNNGSFSMENAKDIEVKLLK